ncbi:DNA-3-methyladenine glycosylase family protein [Bacillus massilinigeriensis]|uniref:DNA-3-methyladenine glycosylase family protein n=1 Tax=Bacillus mediterraneensis TaxID=1805474 RepID=UPI0008F878F4|nr:DNA-3-methyladenine glycosylase [Bacillus mediterraneensis]
MWQETVSIPGPYNFDLACDRLQLDPLHVVDIENRTVKIPVIIDGRKQAVEVKGIGTLEEPSFMISGREEALKEAAIARVAEVFRWDVDLAKVHSHFMATDLAPIFAEHYGTPLVLDFEPLGCLMKCIIHQQLNLSFAMTLTERFVHTYGEKVDDVWFYPDAETVAALTVEELRELQFSGRKAEYVIGIGKLAAEGELDFSEMKERPDAEIEKALLKIRGVGPWTVQNFLMFGLGRPNLFPLADIGIQNALKKLYNLEKKPGVPEMEQWKQPWEPYLSYASLYLWRSIE